MDSACEIVRDWSTQLAATLAAADPDCYVPYLLSPWESALGNDWAIATPHGPPGAGEAGVYYARLPCPVDLGHGMLRTTRQVAEDWAAALNLGRVGKQITPDRGHTASRRSDCTARPLAVCAAQDASVPDRGPIY